MGRQGKRIKSILFFATFTPNPNSAKGNFSRLQIENRVYVSRSFSKIHLSLLLRQDSLQIFQMVVYPKLKFDLPIIYINLVGNKNFLELAIADSLSVRCKKSFPDFYSEALIRLQKHFFFTNTLPNWGKSFYSPLCISIKPKNEEDADRFMKYACSFIRAHFEIARIMVPIKSCQTQLALELIENQRYFRIWQQKNTIMRRILVESLGEKKAHDYLSKFFFGLSEC